MKGKKLVSFDDMETILKHFLFKVNVPICLWGEPGIGKTAFVKSFAEHEGVKLKFIAPAQFEEMGDILGMPLIVDGKTHFASPDWVPVEQGPGILLIDDFNRADDRIIRGLMSLLQFGKTSSWELPPQWQIILTANPDNGDFSVTPLDKAVLTRITNFFLKSSVKEWINWAEKNKIDGRGIDFVVSVPTFFENEGVNARAFTQMLEFLTLIPDWKKSFDLVEQICFANLPVESGIQFLKFVKRNRSSFDTIEKVLGGKGKGVFLGLNSFTSKDIAVFFSQIENNTTANMAKLKKILLSSEINISVRLGVVRDLQNSSNKEIQKVLQSPEVLQLVLNNL